MSNIPQTIFIQEDSFHNAWARAVRYVLRDGRKMTIGNPAEPKPIRDVCSLIELTGEAIIQIERRETHTQYPFPYVGNYCVEFTREYLKEYNKKPDEERFTYLYFDRLVNYGATPIDQMAALRRGLGAQTGSRIASNRNHAVLWQADTDIASDSPPCLQRIWIRHLGEGDVEVHLTWRSRDLFTAWQANIIALIDMINREVIYPQGHRIVKIIDYADSLHIYESDISAAQDVRLVPVSPR